MQVIYQDKNKRYCSREADIMDIIICAERVSEHLERNIMENLESRSLSYTTVREFLLDLKEEFGGEDNEMIKVVELKKVE